MLHYTVASLLRVRGSHIRGLSQGERLKPWAQPCELFGALDLQPVVEFG